MKWLHNVSNKVAWMVKYKKITLLLSFYIVLGIIFFQLKGKKNVFVCMVVCCFFVFLIFLFCFAFFVIFVFVLFFVLFFCVGFSFSFYVLRARGTLKCWSCFNIMLKQNSICFLLFYQKWQNDLFVPCRWNFQNEAKNENENIPLRVYILA